MDLSDPDNPLFCPRATLFGAIVHVFERGDEAYRIEQRCALRILLNAFREVRGEIKWEDMYAETYLDKVHGVVSSCAFADADWLASWGVGVRRRVP